MLRITSTSFWMDFKLKFHCKWVLKKIQVVIIEQSWLGELIFLSYPHYLMVSMCDSRLVG